MIDRTLCVAPMMDWTDRHCRYFMRLLSPHALLYTEMVVSSAVLRGDIEYLLGFNPFEHPLALQLGGSHSKELAAASKIAAEMGYQEINLNVGCPSDRVQSGRFGACLMKEPALVAECVAAMQAQVTCPVTVKTRIGVDEFDSFDFLAEFISTVADAGCQIFIIHARKAWLKGLSPKQNREVPPLNYQRVVELKRAFPKLSFILNGGLTQLEQIKVWLPQCDGVMLGRAAYHNPALLVACEQALFNENFTINYIDVLTRYSEYMQEQLASKVPMTVLIKPLLGLFTGCNGARSWRRCLTTSARKSDPSIVLRAAAEVLT